MRKTMIYMITAATVLTVMTAQPLTAFAANGVYPTIGIAALVMFGIVYFIGCLRFFIGITFSSRIQVFEIHFQNWG